MPESPPPGQRRGTDSRHQRLAKLAAPWRGWLLDLGCGRGATLAHLLPHADAAARLLGVDRDATALAAAGAARAGRQRVALVRAELAAALPIADASVDRVVCHNVLECVPDPAGLLAEIARILRPGGHATIGHSDYDTMVYAGADLGQTRRLVHAYCDTQQAWMDAVDGTIGRRLPAMVGASPLRVDQVHAVVVLEDAFTPDALGFILAHGAARTAVRTGVCTQAEADGWLADLHAAHTQGRYLFSVNDYIVVAAKAQAASHH